MRILFYCSFLFGLSIRFQIWYTRDRLTIGDPSGCKRVITSIIIEQGPDDIFDPVLSSGFTMEGKPIAFMGWQTCYFGRGIDLTDLTPTAGFMDHQARWTTSEACRLQTDDCNLLFGVPFNIRWPHATLNEITPLHYHVAPMWQLKVLMIMSSW